MLRRATGLLLVPYVLWLITAYRYHFLDGVNLAFHEAGHLFLSFFGPTLHILGGTLGQLFFPLACTAHFLRRRERFGAALCGLWTAESLMYVARYMGDARAQVLPLVGGHIHDWNWLLSRAGLLSSCEVLSAALHAVASVLALVCLAAALRVAFSEASEPVPAWEE